MVGRLIFNLAFNHLFWSFSVIFAHIRHENEGGEGPINKRTKSNENHDAGAEDDGMMMITDWIREEEEGNNMEGLGRLMVDEGEEEEAEGKEEKSTSNGGGDEADGKKPPSVEEVNGRRKEGKKHSHTVNKNDEEIVDYPIKLTFFFRVAQQVRCQSRQPLHLPSWHFCRKAMPIPQLNINKSPLCSNHSRFGQFLPFLHH
jgi:hypothetical protein